MKNLNIMKHGKPEKKRFSSMLNAENPLNTALLNRTFAKTLVNRWCGRGDLNPHRLSPTTPSK